MAVVDRRQRPLASLRLSVTDRCNLRCQYCMPEQDYAWLPKPDILEKLSSVHDREGSIDQTIDELMKISGTVYQPDGKTPAANTLIYLYHTDIEGYYGRTSEEHKHGRYRGWMLTNKDGRYAFVTIKPAPYPVNRFAAHIHMTVTTPTAREDWIDSILFEGDNLISSREREEAGRRGGFNPIVSLKKGDGGLYYATRDIQLMA